MSPIASDIFSAAVRPRRRAGSRRVPMTARERQVLVFVALWVAETGQAPLRREIGAGLGISEGQATWHVLALAEKGWLRVTPHTRRGIAIV